MSILEKHWFAFLLVHAFLLQTLAMLLRVATTYQAVAIELDAFWIGVIGGAFGLVPALLGLHMGRYIDRFGERAASIAGSVAAMLAAVGLMLLAPSIVSLLAMSTIIGLGQFIGVAGQHSATGKLELSRQAAAFGWLTTAISVAHAAGPLIVTFFARNQLVPDMEAIFFAGILLSIIMLATALLTRMPAHVSESDTRSLCQAGRLLLGTKGYVPAMLASLVIFSAMDLLVIYLPVYGTERGISAATVGVLLAVRAFASIITRFFFGRIVGMLGRDRVLVLSLLLSSVSIASLTLTSSPVLLGLMLFVAGLGLGVGAPLTLAWITEIAPSGMRGRALSLRLAGNRVGQAALPVALGVIVGATGAGSIMITMAGTLLAVAVASAARARPTV